MNNSELAAWGAGIIGAAGIITVKQEEGPIKGKYMAFTLEVPCGDDSEINRLLTLAGNGTQERGNFVLSGYGAVRGLYSMVWKYLSAGNREQVNQAIRFYKEQKAALK